MVRKVYYTYNRIHQLCQESAPKILNEFQPQLLIAIGGGGYVPARILRSFLKSEGKPNIPIQAIGLSLYESLPPKLAPRESSQPQSEVGTPSNARTNGYLESSDLKVETPGTEVTRTQWLDLSSLEMANLIGKRILIVDEVDDTRTTLEYAVRELQKDIRTAAKLQGRPEAAETTKLGIFVLHNKDKKKKGKLPKDMMDEGRYMAAETTGDDWICYPWEAIDIMEHDRLAGLPSHEHGM